MVATHSVKINGVWYRPGEEIKGKAEDMNPPEYTKTEISRMRTADLKKLAKELDIEEADTYTGADLKKLLVDKLGL